MDYKKELNVSSENKRTPRRRNLIFYSEVNDLNDPKFSGNMIDISTSGIMLSLEKEVREGTRFKFELILPSPIDGKDRIHFSARNKWCKEDINPDYFAAGFEFEEIEDKDEEIIVKIMYEYGFNR